MNRSNRERTEEQQGGATVGALPIHRAVVTGATGMLGATLVRRLLAEGISVLALVRPGSRKLVNLPKASGLQVVEAELSQLGTCLQAWTAEERAGSAAYDAFFHLGWAGTGAKSRMDAALQQKNVSSTLEAVRLAAALGCRVFVGAGSQAEYGRHTKMLTPDTPAHPENEYGRGKLEAGERSRILCRQLGIRHVWIRIFSVYGPFDNENTMVMSGIRRLVRGERPSYTRGEQLWDYLYAEDAARALFLAARKGRDGQIYCLGSGQVRSLADYIRAIRDAVDPQAEVGLGELPYPPGQVMYLQADISRLTADTGFVPEISFEEGIAKTVKWCRRQMTAHR